MLRLLCGFHSERIRGALVRITEQSLKFVLLLLCLISTLESFVLILLFVDFTEGSKDVLERWVF